MQEDNDKDICPKCGKEGCKCDPDQPCACDEETPVEEDIANIQESMKKAYAKKSRVESSFQQVGIIESFEE